MSYQAYLDAIEKKTGHTPQALLDQAAARGLAPTTSCGSTGWRTADVQRDHREILLERPGPPAMDDETAAQVRELVSKGVMGAQPAAKHVTVALESAAFTSGASARSTST